MHTAEDPRRSALQGVSKGGMVEAILTAAARTGEAPDFVLCIGDDRSDEDMFTAMEHVTFSPHLPAEVCLLGCSPDDVTAADAIVNSGGLDSGSSQGSVRLLGLLASVQAYCSEEFSVAST